MSEDARLAEPEFTPKKHGGPRKTPKVRAGGKPAKDLDIARGVWNIYTMEERQGLVKTIPCAICDGKYLPSQMKTHAMACAQAEALRNEKRGQEPDEDE